MQTRRQFVRGAATAGAALIVSPQAAALAGGRRVPLIRDARFSEGVMSGDPTWNSITLWTRLHEASGKGRVRLEVARDSGFRRLVASRTLPTSGSVDHAVKARVKGLSPHEQYWYRFETADGSSPVGRFRTAPPPDSNEPVRFAFFSCQDYTHGWYNAHALMAREDLDFVVCLGDYIYAEVYHSTKDGTAVRNDPVGRQIPGYAEAHTEGDLDVYRVAVNLDEYRRKYALYRKDANLRKVHQRFPLVTTWDDHEIQNNYAGAAPDGGLPEVQRWSKARRRAATKAFYESMPTYGSGSSSSRKLYRSLRFGRNVELFMLDERSYRADQPCGDEVAPACAEWDQPRDFLGRAQMTWLKKGLAASKANWKVIGNEVMAMPAKVLGDSFFTFDMWHGYPREREELLQHIRSEGIKDVVFVTGDIHTFIAGDVRTDMGKGEPVALEFVGGSITSSGLGETDINAGGGTVIKGNDQNPNTDPALIQALKDINPWVDEGDFDSHGYGLVEASRTGMDVRFRRLETIKRKTTKTKPLGAFRWKVERGQTSIVGK